MHFTRVFTPHSGSRDFRLSVSQNSHFTVIVMDICEHFASPFSFPSFYIIVLSFLDTSSTNLHLIRSAVHQPNLRADPRKEDCGSMAKSRSPTGYAPKVLDTSDEFNVHRSIFQSSDLNNIYNLGIDLEESANAEIDDEHIRDAFASPLFSLESEAEADRLNTCS